MERRPDGSAGVADYGVIGVDYARYRRPEPRVARELWAALGSGARVLNVGAGAGSYQPTDRAVVALEPSAAMRAQRPVGAAPVVGGAAERLPFRDGGFDAAMASFTVHQWSDLEAGLAELRRVTRGPVAVLTCDPALVERYWLADYAPEVLATEARRYPEPGRILAGLGGGVVHAVPVPWSCTDGFGEAYYGRPELLLDPGARRANSAWNFVGPEVHDRFERRLASDLESGVWDARWGGLRSQSTFDGSLVLVVSPAA